MNHLKVFTVTLHLRYFLKTEKEANSIGEHDVASLSLRSSALSHAAIESFHLETAIEFIATRHTKRYLKESTSNKLSREALFLLNKCDLSILNGFFIKIFLPSVMIQRQKYNISNQKCVDFHYFRKVCAICVQASICYRSFSSVHLVKLKLKVGRVKSQSLEIERKLRTKILNIEF